MSTTQILPTMPGEALPIPARQTISFVVAVYRNAGAITPTYEKIRSVFAESLNAYDYEIVFVDDGSDDGSLQEILDLREHDQRIKAITFTRNFGQMSAMLAGLAQASGAGTINISADLQDPVELIPQMVGKWREGAEIVVCYRTDRSDTLSAKVFSRFAYGALRLAIPEIPPGGFDFVLMDRKALDEFNAIDVRNRFFQGDLLWTGYRTSFIPYVRLKRTIGKSQYNLRKKLKNFLDAFLDASYLPIRFISLAGIVTATVGLLYSLTIVYAWLRGDTPFAGWAPLMIVVLLVGGLIMFMLGIIGEYIWRIYDEVRKKPNYIVREKYL
ncbi:MAG: glycosyltransferase family 2 protein [Luteimonas sp.]